MKLKKPEELPSRAKLSITPSNGSSFNGTHDEEVIKCKKGDRKMAKDPCDSRRKKELIIGRHIPIDIYKGYDEVRIEVNRNVL